MNVYQMPLKGMKEGRIVREIHCAICDSVDFFLPEDGKPSNSEIICCAESGAPVGAYKDLLALLEGGPGVSKQCKAVSRIEWERFDYHVNVKTAEGAQFAGALGAFDADRGSGTPVTPSTLVWTCESVSPSQVYMPRRTFRR